MTQKDLTYRLWLVYSHISPSGKVYIGITSRKPKLRWGKNGLGYLNKKRGKFTQRYFANAILKYGWNNILHKVLYTNLTKLEACRIEKHLIAYYKSMGMSYNITDGGDGTLGVPGRKGPRPKEVGKKISASRKGLKFSEEHKRNLSLSHLGHKLSEETRRKMSEAQKIMKSNYNPKSKKVIVINIITKETIRFRSAAEASRHFSVSKNCISDHCLKGNLYNKKYKMYYESA